MATLSQSLMDPISGMTELAAENTWLIISVCHLSGVLADDPSDPSENKQTNKQTKYFFFKNYADLSGVLADNPGDEVDVVDGAVVEDPSADLQVVQGR